MKLLQYLRCSIILAAMNPIALMAQISTQGGVVVVDDNFNAIGLPIGPGDTDVRPYNIFLNSNFFQGEAVLSLENSQLVSKRLITMRDPSSPELNGSIVNIGAGSSIFTGYVTNPSCSPLDLASQGAAVMNINGLFASKPALTPQPPFSCSHDRAHRLM